MASPTPPTHNWLQRKYFAWAKPHYARMSPAVRSEVERIDRYIYSGEGLWVWALLLAFVGSLAGAASALFGAAPLGALGMAVGLTVGMVAAVTRAWLEPETVVASRFVHNLIVMAAWAAIAISVAVAMSMWASGDAITWEALVKNTSGPLRRAGSVVTFVAVLLICLQALTAQTRRWRMARELAAERAFRERDAIARQLAEARLRDLQAQIHPHFMFNTLAAIQHWVDVGDPRAPALLRSLTAFLRAATELFGQSVVMLEEEARWVGHYLDVQRARLGDRLHSHIAIAPDCAALPWPPGLLMTLVENAIEHGIAPALQGGEVWVSAQREGNTIVVSVCDSGVGPPSSGVVDGVGLRNSRERLASQFGPEAALAITARAEGGTCATAVCPAPKGASC